MDYKVPEPGSKGCKYTSSSCPTLLGPSDKVVRMEQNADPLHRHLQKRCEVFLAWDNPKAKCGKISIDS